MEGEIIVAIDAAGNTIVSVNGISGKGCKDLTRDLERILGTVITDTPTREMREEPNERSSNRRRS